MSSVSDIKLIRTDTTLDLSQKAEKRCPKWPTPARVLHRSCTEDMVVLLQPRLPCPECQPASATTQQQAFLSDGSGHCSLCCSTATHQPTRQVTLSFNSPYKRANFRDDFLVYDHTTGKTPVLVLCRSRAVESVILRDLIVPLSDWIIIFFCLKS